MKVYISGKIGEDVPSSETIAKFNRAEKRLKELGFETFNPATAVNLHAIAIRCAELTGTTFYQEILMLDLEKVARCDAILQLGDWRDSAGATVEVALGVALGKPFFRLVDGMLRSVCRTHVF